MEFTKYFVAFFLFKGYSSLSGIIENPNPFSYPGVLIAFKRVAITSEEEFLFYFDAVYRAIKPKSD